MQGTQQYRRFGYKPLGEETQGPKNYDQLMLEDDDDDMIAAEQVSVSQRLKSPLFVMAGLLGVSVVLALVIMNSYPESANDSGIPVVKAEANPVKIKPDDKGGMEIAHQDSTIFDTIRSDSAMEAMKSVENLLETYPGESATVDLEVKATPSAQVMDITDGMRVNASLNANSETIKITEAVRPAENPAVQKAEVAEEVVTQAVAVEVKQDKPSEMHAAGASPDTLAFVRSVLNQKDSKQSGQPITQTDTGSPNATAKNLNDIEAASGTPVQEIEKKPVISGAVNGSGSHFVQIASVSSESAAASEWPRIVKKYDVLSDSEYRIQQADLGNRGVFYRIQAGPFAEDQAKSICGSIKEIQPGGCLVVRR